VTAVRRAAIAAVPDNRPFTYFGSRSRTRTVFTTTKVTSIHGVVLFVSSFVTIVVVPQLG
jgi:hypothetical protein